jgi:hypothetical protein
VLGFIVENGCVQEDESRKAVIQNMEFPRTIRQLWRFIGFVGFGRQFYKNLSEILAPLTAFLKKGGKIGSNPRKATGFKSGKTTDV